MFFRRFNFNIFYINFYRFLFFIILSFFLISDVSSNFFLCSFLNTFLLDLSIIRVLCKLLVVLVFMLIIKALTIKKKNLINFILIDSYLLISFMLKNINKYFTFLNLNFSVSYLLNLVFFIKNNIILNSRVYYIYIYILRNLINRNFN
jgi:hypothetical protein